jgi:hypothetical protein
MVEYKAGQIARQSTVDASHLFIGETLIFDIELLEIL